MREYKIVFTVDGKRTEQYVNANSSTDAKRFVEMQYSNHRVSIVNVQDVKLGHYL